MEQQRDRSLYATQLQRVADVWPSDPELGVQLLLDEAFCPPSRRDFAWRYWMRLCQRAVWHVADGGPFAVTPDGSQIACLLPDQLRVVRSRDGAVVKQFGPPTSGAAFTASRPVFSPGGAYLAAPGREAIAVWNLSDDDRVQMLATELQELIAAGQLPSQR